MIDCKYPDCFNCDLEDCVMTDRDIKLMLTAREQGAKRRKVCKGTKRVLRVHGNKFVVLVLNTFDRDGEKYCNVRPVNFIGDVKTIRASMLE